MLGDPKAHAMVTGVHGQWLSLDDIQGAQKDPAVFPTFGTRRMLARPSIPDRPPGCGR